MKNFINKLMCLGVIFGLTFQAVPIWALEKDETIYAKLDNDGKPNQVIVSEHLKGTDEKAYDKTKLENIQNINGDEKYTLDNGKLTWESNGKDIYYQGVTKEELPVTLNITYYLNGEKMNVSDMLGKKGTVKMVLKYTNNDSHSININGRYETLYTPFVVATTTIIPNTSNKNIDVTNGKVVNNGTSSVIVALTTPGLYESLKMDKLQNMDTAVITYDTDSFELNSIYAVATPKLLDSSDLKVFDHFDGIYSSNNTLVNSSNQIKNGSGTLLQGANKLQEGVQKIKDGINSAYLGSNEIKTQVSNAIDALNNDNTPAIDNETLAYIKNQAKQGAIQKVELSFTDEYKAQIAQMALQELQNNSTYQQLKGAIAQYEEAGIKQLIGACQTITEENQEMCMAKANDITQYKAYVQSVTLMEETAKATAVSTAEKTAKQTAGKVSEEVSESVATQVATSAKKTATEKTASSLNQLLGGLTQLTSGLNELNLGMDSLNTGTGDLKTGIATLDSGIQQFNNQGISKINELVNGDVKSIEQRVKALAKLSANYTTFDENGENTTGTSKIIMIVDGISKPKEVIQKIDIISDENKSLWDKIKGLFE